MPDLKKFHLLIAPFLLFYVVFVANAQKTDNQKGIEQNNTTTFFSSKAAYYYETIHQNLNLGENEQLQKNLKEFKDYTEEHAHIEGKILLAYIEGLIAERKGNYPQALSFILEGLRNSEELPASNKSRVKLLLRGYTPLSTIYNITGNYTNALSTLFQALELAQENQLLLDQAKIYNGLAMTYASVNEYNKAIEYCIKAKDLATELGDKNGIARTSGNLAGLYTDSGKPQMAIPILRNIIQLDYEIGAPPLNLAYHYQNIGLAFIKTEKLDSANFYLNKGLKIAEENNITAVLPPLYNAISMAHAELGKYSKAVTFGEKGLKLAEEMGSVELVGDIYRTLGIFEAHNKNTKNAIDYLSKSHELRDSVDKAFDIQQAIKLEKQLELKQIEIKQRQLEQEQAMQKITIANQQIIIGLITTILLLSFIAGIIAFRQNKQLKYAYKVLVDKNRALIRKENTNELPYQPTAHEIEKSIDSQNSDLKKRILILVEEEKVFLDEQLSLFKFADLLGSNSSYISKCINQNFNKNFNNFINEYRIKEVLLGFEKGIHNTMTIDAIGKKVGFKSKSVFYSHFKKHTGMTPYVYIQQMK